MSVIQVIQGDITKLRVDAIVNAANNALSDGAGVNGAIHRAAGEELVEACRRLHGCETGRSKITKGFRLPAQYIIHTVGPVWRDGSHGEDELLASCYRTALQLANEYRVKTLAFPCISTGIFGFPFERAATIAYTAISEWVKTEMFFEKIFLVCFSETDQERYKKVIQGITS